MADIEPESPPCEEWSAGRLLADWQDRVTLALFAYNRAANRCQVWDVRIGGAVAVLTALVSTSIFVSIREEEAPLWAKVSVGALSVVAAIASGVQAFAGMTQRIEDYQRAARRYSSLRREIEEARLLTGEIPKDEVTRVRKLLDEASEASPNAPRRIWNKTRRHVKGEFSHLERFSDWVRGLPPRKRLGLQPDDATWQRGHQ